MIVQLRLLIIFSSIYPPPPDELQPPPVDGAVDLPVLEGRGVHVVHEEGPLQRVVVALPRATCTV